MKLSIASDHGGVKLKQEIIEKLSNVYTFIDCGTNSEESCDYPDYAIKAATLVANKEVDYGIVICKSGIGVSIAANKVKTIRCALVKDVKNASLCKQHNNANMIALSANDTNVECAIEIIKTWLNEKFLGMQHQRRIDKISKYETEH